MTFFSVFQPSGWRAEAFAPRRPAPFCRVLSAVFGPLSSRGHKLKNRNKVTSTDLSGCALLRMTKAEQGFANKAKPAFANKH